MDEYSEARFDWQTKVTAIYREVVGNADETEGASRQDAFTQATALLLALVDAGDLKPPVDEVIRAALLDADRRDARNADTVLRKAIRGGEECLDLDGDPILEVVVSLGGGRRKPWRSITAVDLQEMDDLRYRNVRFQQDAYNAWRDDYTVALSAVVQYGTFGNAHTAGGFVPLKPVGLV